MVTEYYYYVLFVSINMALLLLHCLLYIKAHYFLCLIWYLSIRELEMTLIHSFIASSTCIFILTKYVNIELVKFEIEYIHIVSSWPYHFCYNQSSFIHVWLTRLKNPHLTCLNPISRKGAFIATLKGKLQLRPMSNDTELKKINFSFYSF